MVYSERPKPKFRVVIVGGSIAGLTLAHCLIRQNVDFVVLESHEDIAPQVGASIGILPNGARILDQLGLFDDILAATEPLRETYVWTAHSKLITQSKAPDLLHARHGYPIAFLDRQIVLEILYRHLERHQNCVFTGKKVVRVDCHPGGVKAHCADGSVFEGDLVVGADGVRSKVREQMWEYVEARGLREEVSRERETMVSQYSCVFGISAATPGLIAGTGHRTFGEGWSFLTIVGKESRVYWFVFQKLDQKYPASRIPRFDQAMVDQYVQPYLQQPISDSVPFAEVYKRAITRTLLPLEEACYKRWAIDRWACIGDSVHKMTPNMGQGGNSAIESAAALANSLSSLLSHFGTAVPVEQIDRCLQLWQAKRRPRAQTICNKARSLTRLEALDTLKDKLVGLYLLPYLDEYVANLTSETIIDATKVDYLPVPVRSLTCTMRFLDSSPVQKASFWVRILWISPLLGIFAVGKALVAPLVPVLRPHLLSVMKTGTWIAGNGQQLNLTTPFYNIGFLDKLMQPLITCFLPSITGTDPESRIQMLSFMNDLGPVYTIWLLESYRTAHSRFGVLLPLTAGAIFQLVGIWQVAPLYLALEYLRTPLSTLLVGDNRKINSGLVVSLILSVLAGYHTVTYANFFAPTVQSRQWFNALWQLFPLTIPLLQVVIYLVLKLAFPPSRFQPGNSKSTHTQKLQPCRAPVSQRQHHRPASRSLLYVSAALVFLPALTFLNMRSPVLTCALPSLPSPFTRFLVDGAAATPPASFEASIARFLQYDELLSMAAAFTWVALRLRELHAAGAPVPWVMVFCAIIASLVLFGPGATFVLGWALREAVLEDLAARVTDARMLGFRWRVNYRERPWMTLRWLSG
ncbi:hypothetical protein BDW74DRAFT_180789 [Aspergillus multicolor]|uniref:FAD-dependent oxidoreductase n=1 Tax=Aspergillus multicolor TaxID=41759 RepID=UPI003CCCB308